MMAELGTVIDESGAHLHALAFQISAGKAFKNRLAAGAARAMNKIRGRGEEVKAVNVMIEGSGTDGNIIMLTFGDLDGCVRRHFRVADKGAKEMGKGVVGGDLEIRAMSGKGKGGGVLGAIGRVGRERPELRV